MFFGFAKSITYTFLNGGGLVNFFCNVSTADTVMKKDGEVRTSVDFTAKPASNYMFAFAAPILIPRKGPIQMG